MSDSIFYDVVVLPAETLASKAIAASQSLSHFDSLFVLGANTYYPHVSLYMLQLKSADIEYAKLLLSDISNRTLRLSLQAIRYDHSHAFVDAEYQLTSELDSLQRNVIVALNPLRDGMRDKDKARMLQASGLAHENYQAYGYKQVGGLFRPHITFSRLKQENPQALDLLGDISNYRGEFPRIGLFEIGANGTCVRKIGEWDLAG